jgi:type I restriction enzyme S subunit
MSEVKNIPRLRFPEFDNQKIYNSRLGDIAEVRDGTHDSPKYVDKGYPLITSKNLNQNGTLSFDNINFISENDFLQINKRSKVDVGDILFGMIGTIGNPVRINSDGFAIKNVALIKEKLELQNNFLLYYLNSHNIQKQFYRENAGGTQKFIALNLIRNLSINHPSLPEQQKIADFLTAVDKRIELLEKKKTLLETYKKGVMKKIFNQEIRFKDDYGKDFPNWEEKRLAEVSESISVKNHQIPSNNILSEGNIPVIDQGKDMVKGFSNQSEKTFRTDGVVVFGDHTTILKYIDFDFIVGGDGVKLISSNTIDMKYLYYNMVYNNVSTEGYKRHFSILKNIMIQIPYQEEQVKISEFLSSIDNQIELLESQINKSKTWKKGLLQKMFV